MKHFLCLLMVIMATVSTVHADPIHVMLPVDFTNGSGGFTMGTHNNGAVVMVGTRFSVDRTYSNITGEVLLNFPSGSVYLTQFPTVFFDITTDNSRRRRPAAVLATTSVTVNKYSHDVYAMSFDNLKLQKGHTYWIVARSNAVANPDGSNLAIWVGDHSVGFTKTNINGVWGQSVQTGLGYSLFGVPEPGSLLLLGIGLAALTFARKPRQASRTSNHLTR